MKLLRCSEASLAICGATLALAAPSASAAITLVNAGFETATTTGWSGSGTVAAGYAGFTAPAGSYFGIVRSPGCPGETLEQQFTADAGDVLAGWAFFSTSDYLPWDDHGDVRIVIEQTATDAIVFSSSVAEVGAGGSTPWTRFTYAFQSPGSYLLRTRVENFDDCGGESAIGLDMDEGSPDDDADAIFDDADNCPGTANPDQLNHDGDEQGDACDADDDNDTVDDAVDNCQLVVNTDQADNDADRDGDACDADDDNDTVLDERDNCPMVANPGQRDDDHDGIGNVCDEAFDSSAGKATGGGWVRHDGHRVSFSVSAKSRHGALDGTCKVTFRRTKITCTDLQGYSYDATEHMVVIVGAATIDGVPTRYRIVLRDATEDRFRITTDAGFVAGGAISCGKVRIRQG